ncbi:MAG: transcription-repair coupling factor, partial [Prevotella sp.]|nr:transcription-repair coupling factor [Prevotella sp.]
MNLRDISELYAKSPQSEALAKMLGDKSIKTVFLQGLVASSAPMLFSSVTKKTGIVCLFILGDAEEAGYFYHDLTQILGNEDVLYFPSSYRRQIKYGQRDSANEILRTEVLSRLAAMQQGTVSKNIISKSAVQQNTKQGTDNTAKEFLFVVTSPEAVGELVVSRERLDENTISLRVGEMHDITELEKTLWKLGFKSVDYVYEPGQFAIRGSILDVFSFSSEYPFRIDFFGDEIDSIRTFDVQSQLSKEKKKSVEIVPELFATGEKVSFFHFLPKETVLVMKDITYVRDIIDRAYQDGFTSQAMTEKLEGLTEVEQQKVLNDMKITNMLLNGAQFVTDTQDFCRIEIGTKPTGVPQATLSFDFSPQPLFHKSFDLLVNVLEDYVQKGYRIYILADSGKQHERLKEIFASEEFHTNIQFVAVYKTLHSGFADNTMPACFFTDHQIFDRFHKYSLRSDAARTGKMALTMKELQEMEIGDYIVHVDFGIGKFAGLVRVPAGNSYQEVIRLIYQHNDKVDVSIHSLYKISKYKRHDSDAPPRLSTLGTGAWERLKERTKSKIKDIARDLIKLYAARRHEQGYAFSGDTFMQH